MSVLWSRGRRALCAAGLLLAAGSSQAVLIPFDVGDSVGLNFNGPVFAETRLGVSATALFHDVNTGASTSSGSGVGLRYSSAGLYAKASAHAGQVGAATFLDWRGPYDNWSAGASAQSADVATISNPTMAGQVVSVLLVGSASGGLSVGGSAARSDASAEFSFAGITGLHPYFGAPNAEFALDGAGGGYASIFRDSGQIQIVGSDSDGNNVVQAQYGISPRWTTWQVDVMLDASGSASFWTSLAVTTAGSENGDCIHSTYAQCNLEYGVAASDYSHTVTAYYSALSPGTTITSQAGWGPSPVPEPETYVMLLAGLGLLGFAARRRKQKTKEDSSLQIESATVVRCVMGVRRVGSGRVSTPTV